MCFLKVRAISGSYRCQNGPLCSAYGVHGTSAVSGILITQQWGEVGMVFLHTHMD